MIARHLTQKLGKALRRAPVVLLTGPRQSGKTTLVKGLAADGFTGEYQTLDSATTLAAAEHDPSGFVRQILKPVIIDEVQRVPELFLAIKQDVDENRTPGRYLLTGSANILMMGQMADKLVGRMEMLTLWPFSESERQGVQSGFLDQCFAQEPFSGATGSSHGTDRSQMAEILLRGGFPEPSQRETPEDRAAWFDSYLTTVMQREVKDLSRIEGLYDLPRLLTLLAGRASGLLNATDISRDSGIPLTSLRRYLTLMEATFLFSLLPAWSQTLRNRVARAPKVMLGDTGLASHLLGLDAARLVSDGRIFGALLENFVYLELAKQSGWYHDRLEIFHYREHSGQEVDIVLVNRQGMVTGVEVKSAGSVTASDFKSLHHMKLLAKDNFQAGIVLYMGDKIIPFGENLLAVPVCRLWEC